MRIFEIEYKLKGNTFFEMLRARTNIDAIKSILSKLGKQSIFFKLKAIKIVRVTV